MAQADFFQMSVAYPLKNAKFRLPTQYSTTLSANAAASQANLSIPSAPSGIDRFLQVVNVDDRLVIGPNSSGVSETAIVKSFTTDATIVVTLKSNLTNAFSSSDVVLFKGTKLGGGWFVSGNGAEANEINPKTIMPSDLSEREPYGQFISQPTLPIETRSGLQQDLDTDILEQFTWYRIGCQFRSDIDNISGLPPSFQVQIQDFGGINTTRDITSSDQVDWTRFQTTGGFFIRSDSGTNSPYIRFIWRAGSGDVMRIWLRGVFLEHAKGVGYVATRVKDAFSFSVGSIVMLLDDNVGINNFDVSVGDKVAVYSSDLNKSAVFLVNLVGASPGGLNCTLLSGDIAAAATDSFIHKDNNGTYTFPDHPIQSSIRYGRISNQKTAKLGDESARLFQPSTDGDRSYRWIFSCRFGIANQDIWDAMMALLSWQERGNLITLHPFIDDLPHVMIGRMSITNVTKSHYDFSRRDFTLLFEELIT